MNTDPALLFTPTASDTQMVDSPSPEFANDYAAPDAGVFSPIHSLGPRPSLPSVATVQDEEYDTEDDELESSPVQPNRGPLRLASEPPDSSPARHAAAIDPLHTLPNPASPNRRLLFMPTRHSSLSPPPSFNPGKRPAPPPIDQQGGGPWREASPHEQQTRLRPTIRVTSRASGGSPERRDRRSLAIPPIPPFKKSPHEPAAAKKNAATLAMPPDVRKAFAAAKKLLAKEQAAASAASTASTASTSAAPAAPAASAAPASATAGLPNPDYMHIHPIGTSTYTPHLFPKPAELLAADDWQSGVNFLPPPPDGFPMLSTVRTPPSMPMATALPPPPPDALPPPPADLPADDTASMEVDEEYSFNDLAAHTLSSMH